MSYGYLNNFSQALAAELAEEDKIIVLTAGAERLNFAAHESYTLTLSDDQGNVEIVEAVRSEGGQSLYTYRAQEETIKRAWPIGTVVEARLTAGTLESFLPKPGDSVELGDNAEVQGSGDGVAIGRYAIAIKSGVALGAGAEAEEDAVALGDIAKARVEQTLAVSGLAVADAQNGPYSLQATVALHIDFSKTTGGNYVYLPKTGVSNPRSPLQTLFFIDSLDLIITESSAAGGTPKIKIGSSLASEEDVLAATDITITGVGIRQNIVLTSDNGLPELFVKVAEAATGTLKGFLVFKGYALVMPEGS